MCFTALAAKGVFFAKVHCQAPAPTRGDQRLAQARGHAGQAHLPGEDQNYRLQISVSLMLLSERLKCFTCEIKSWSFYGTKSMLCQRDVTEDACSYVLWSPLISHRTV